MTQPPPRPDPGALPALVVGAGLMGRWHARELEAAGGRVVAICDRDRAAAEALGRRHPEARAGSDLAELLSLAGPAVVHVCTPTESHAGIVEQALAAGAHVLAEKPLAPDAATSRELLDRARSDGLLACPTHQYLFQPGFAVAEAALREHGPLVFADLVACSTGGELNPAATAESMLAEIVPHPLAVLERLLPGGIETLEWATLGSSGELRAVAQADDAVVSLHISLSGRPTRNQMRLALRHATVELDFFHGFAFVEPGGKSRAHKICHPFSSAMRRWYSASRNLGVRAIRREPAYPGLRELIRRFYLAVRDGEPCPIPADETIAVADVRDRLTGLR